MKKLKWFVLYCFLSSCFWIADGIIITNTDWEPIEFTVKAGQIADKVTMDLDAEPYHIPQNMIYAFTLVFVRPYTFQLTNDSGREISVRAIKHDGSISNLIIPHNKSVDFENLQSLIKQGFHREGRPPAPPLMLRTGGAAGALTPSPEIDTSDIEMPRTPPMRG